MKKLELNQMEGLDGGVSHTNIGHGITAACVAVGLVAVASGFFTFGASTIWGLTMAGAFCTGFEIGSLTS
jgi:hypothetical protein